MRLEAAAKARKLAAALRGEPMDAVTDNEMLIRNTLIVTTGLVVMIVTAIIGISLPIDRTLEIKQLEAKHAEALQAHQKVFNVAGDCSINSGLAAEKIALPTFKNGATAVYPSTFGMQDGLLTEEYYAQLMKNAKEVTVGGAGAGDCGSGADGHARPHEKGAPAPLDLKNPVPRGDAPGVSNAEADLIRKQTAEDVSAFKQRGTIPGWMDRWADELLHPKLDCKRLLRAVVRRGVTNTQGCVDFVWTRPNRRQHAYTPFIMPAMRQPQPRVAFVIDTSGSMSKPELAQGITEVDGVLKTLNAIVVVLSVDAAVHVIKDVRSRKEIVLRGGGGTDMRIGIDAALELKPPPHIIIVVTDGETPWPTAAPHIPVVIALTGASAKAGAPGWATVVEIIP